MPICSYVVFPEPGRRDELAGRLGAVPGCSVEPASNRDLMLLVTETDGPDEERRLLARLNGVDAIQCMVLAFGEIDPDTSMGDPIEEMKTPKFAEPADRADAAADGASMHRDGGAHGSS